jgi:hypothetical protein
MYVAEVADNGEPQKGMYDQLGSLPVDNKEAEGGFDDESVRLVAGQRRGQPATMTTKVVRVKEKG